MLRQPIHRERTKPTGWRAGPWADVLPHVKMSGWCSCLPQVKCPRSSRGGAGALGACGG
ncbi:hypothetical protein ACFOLD_06595 [Kocuria carniphila]|uniref:hypothetical protein n=1 Tax=Kocuria carniphila TaxID=262208 RepID=UPI00362179C3